MHTFSFQSSLNINDLVLFKFELTTRLKRTDYHLEYMSFLIDIRKNL